MLAAFNKWKNQQIQDPEIPFTGVSILPRIAPEMNLIEGLAYCLLHDGDEGPGKDVITYTLSNGRDARKLIPPKFIWAILYRVKYAL